MQEHALRDKKKSFISKLVVIWLNNVTKLRKKSNTRAPVA